MNEQLTQALILAIPSAVASIVSIIALFVAFGRRKIDSAAIRDEAIALGIERELFVLKTANQSNDMAIAANKARDAAEQAAAVASASDAKVLKLEAKVDDLEKSGAAKDNQIKTLEARVDDLEKQVAVSKEELKDKDAIIADLTADNRRLNLLVEKYAAAAPSNVPPTPLSTAAPPVIDVNIVSQSQPVEVIDDHAAANAENTARIAAELSRRAGVIAPPDVDDERKSA